MSHTGVTRDVTLDDDDSSESSGPTESGWWVRQPVWLVTLLLIHRTTGHLLRRVSQLSAAWGCARCLGNRHPAATASGSELLLTPQYVPIVEFLF